MEALHQVLCLVMFLAWQVSSALEGIEEGTFIFAKDRSDSPELKKYNFHKFWTLQRVVAGIGLPFVYIAGEVVIRGNIWVILFNLVLLMFSMVLTFSLWHNGHLYLTYNKWAGRLVYPGGFRDNKDGPAKLDFTFNQRVAMASVGVSLYIFFMWTHIQPFMEPWQYRNLFLVIIGVISLGTLIYYKVYLKSKNVA